MSILFLFFASFFSSRSFPPAVTRTSQKLQTNLAQPFSGIALALMVGDAADCEDEKK